MKKARFESRRLVRTPKLMKLVLNCGDPKTTHVEVDIDEWSYDSFMLLLQYHYEFDIDLDESNAAAALRIGCYFKDEKMTHFVAHWILDNMSVDIVYNLLDCRFEKARQILRAGAKSNVDLFDQITHDKRWRNLDVTKMKAMLPEEIRLEIAEAQDDFANREAFDVSALREACRKAQAYAPQPVKALSRNSTLAKIAAKEKSAECEREISGKKASKVDVTNIIDVVSEDGFSLASRPQSAARRRPNTTGPLRPQFAALSDGALDATNQPFSAAALVEAAIVGAVQNLEIAQNVQEGGHDNEFEGVPRVEGHVQDVENDDDFNTDLENFVMPPKQVRPTSAVIAHQANMKRQRPATAQPHPTQIEEAAAQDVNQNEARPATATAARPSSGSAARPRAQFPAIVKKSGPTSARAASAQLPVVKMTTIKPFHLHKASQAYVNRHRSHSRPTTADRTSRPSSSGRVSWYAISDTSQSRPSSGASRPFSGSSRPRSASRTGGRPRSSSRPLSGTTGTARDRSSSRPVSGTTKKPVASSYKLSGWLYVFKIFIKTERSFAIFHRFNFHFSLK